MFGLFLINGYLKYFLSVVTAELLLLGRLTRRQMKRFLSSKNPILVWKDFSLLKEIPGEIRQSGEGLRLGRLTLIISSKIRRELEEPRPRGSLLELERKGQIIFVRRMLERRINSTILFLELFW